MTPNPPRNVGASVRARLTLRARKRKENVQLVLTHYAIERLLYRLSLSDYSSQFVLKGAMLVRLWTPAPYRATADLDLLGFGDDAPERICAVFRNICVLEVPNDGVIFKPETLEVVITRIEVEYGGIRLTMIAEVAGARLPVRIDIGFGDVVTPSVREIDYPSMLDMPAPKLRAYPPETVIAEKFQALVFLGMSKSLEVIMIIETSLRVHLAAPHAFRDCCASASLDSTTSNVLPGALPPQEIQLD